MSMRRMAVLYAQVGLLLLAVFAHAASRSKDIQIKVLDSETKQFNDDNNGVPLNCDQLTFDAYCRSTRNPPMISTLLVQAGDGPPFRIRCTIESRNSQCTPFAKGETFDARREKHGLTVYYVDDKGRARKQFYTFVDSGGKAGPPPVVAAAAIQPIPAAKDAGNPRLRQPSTVRRRRRTHRHPRQPLPWLQWLRVHRRRRQVRRLPPLRKLSRRRYGAISVRHLPVRKSPSTGGMSAARRRRSAFVPGRTS